MEMSAAREIPGLLARWPQTLNSQTASELISDDAARAWARLSRLMRGPSPAEASGSNPRPAATVLPFRRPGERDVHEQRKD